MVPAPPEFSHVYGFSYWMNWAAHIWCWPTPATYSASGPAIAPSRSMTYCGASEPSAGSS